MALAELASWWPILPAHSPWHQDDSAAMPRLPCSMQGRGQSPMGTHCSATDSCVPQGKSRSCSAENYGIHGGEQLACPAGRRQGQEQERKAWVKA